MNKSNVIELRIETPAIGTVYTEVQHSLSEPEDGLVVKIPRENFCGTSYLEVDLSHVVSNDIKMFEELNKRNDENHQVYVDTLCAYGVKISGNYIRVQYYFNQDGNPEIKRMCAGVMTHSFCNYYKHYAEESTYVVVPECYSSDVCVYW